MATTLFNIKDFQAEIASNFRNWLHYASQGDFIDLQPAANLDFHKFFLAKYNINLGELDIRLKAANKYRSEDRPCNEVSILFSKYNYHFSSLLIDLVEEIGISARFHSRDCGLVEINAEEFIEYILGG